MKNPVMPGFVLCSREESNLNFKIRNLMSYPLNDGSGQGECTIISSRI